MNDLFDFTQQLNAQKARYSELIDIIRHNNELYYAQAQPEISDADYDALYRELEEIEAKQPDWLRPESPTQQVGNDLSEGFRKITHALPMQSIDDIFERKPELDIPSDQELLDFHKKIAKSFASSMPRMSIEPKIDGCAVSLLYKNGKLDYAATRGDGRIGDDVTKNMLRLRDIPKQLPKGAPALLELRGEIFMRFADFEQLNAQRDADGMPAFANPRNAAAGSMKLLDADEVEKRKLSFICHGIGQYEGESISCNNDFIALLHRMTIPTNEPQFHAESLAEMREGVAQINLLRHQLPYGTDGAVIKIEDFATREQMGSTARAPRWAAAYKFLPEQKETTLLNISIQLGRTGVLTPVAELQPVPLSGSVVSRATLHNQDEIERKDIRIGDTVLVEKAGEIIPSVVRVNKDKRPADSQPYNLYEAVSGQCPCCKAPIAQELGQVAWRCSNLTCPAQAAMRSIHFCRRENLNIESLGGSVAESLVERGLISNPLDLFKLTLEQLGSLNLGTDDEPRRMGEKNAAKALAALDAARHLPLDRWISALGISNIGVVTARELASSHEDLRSLANSAYLRSMLRLDALCEDYNNIPQNQRAEDGAAIYDEIEAAEAASQPPCQIGLRTGKSRKASISLINPIGKVATAAIVNYFDSPAGQQLLETFEQLSINPKSESFMQDSTEGILSGQNFVLTGSMSQPRPHFGKLIVAAGGKLQSSINAKTNYLVAGEGGGSKRDKAAKLNISIIGEEELLAMLSPSNSSEQEEPFILS